MLATIAATVFDFSGHVKLDLLPDSTDGEVRRRVNRVATLDGGAVVNDGGYSEADRTLVMRWRPVSAAFEANVQRLVSTYATIQASTRAGFFLVAPETYTSSPGESSLRMLVLEKLSA